ncbi:dipeptidase PepE [Flammeovirga yaeyamensis]|uniref:dipeptidase E n=1 Tax=Flammeovirga yaeyamensis TaxID=367791 RepID=A0AAX1NB78_9BACT|nr:dipeptidase PepE [Flammeovirga yaeyamensis]MBB3698888.1 dipeptidase E [Flammeovirga yaeyamensis]QWG03716.1 dipeptidase PepE [Flammeovirga yaeyamensis]
MSIKNLLIVSTSTVHGKGYLAYCEEAIQSFFSGIEEVIFIPYARPGGITHEEYTEVACKKFNELGFKMRGLHEFDNPIEAIENAKGIFTGGGNTFVLLDQLQKNNLIPAIQKKVSKGLRYMGTSAGSNITGLTVNTTNDMPIVHPESLNALALVPFNLNPHYLDPDPTSKHMGETRETRIKEFHAYNNQVVVGLREGSWLHVQDNKISLEGPLSARIFEKDKTPYELNPSDDFSFLLK